MQWFKLVGECNKLKAKTMFDASLVSSSGFLLNCTYVVASMFLEVCDSEKQNVLDPSFWLQLGAFGWEKETPLSSTETVVAYRARESKRGGRILAPNVALLNELGYSALNLFHSAMAGEKDVGRFQIQVQPAVLMHFRQRLVDLADPAKHLRRFRRARLRKATQPPASSKNWVCASPRSRCATGRAGRLPGRSC